MNDSDQNNTRPASPLEHLVRRLRGSLNNHDLEKAAIEAADKIERLRKDAERYRWLRKRVGVDCNGPYHCIENLKPEATDAAIDAAMRFDA